MAPSGSAFFGARAELAATLGGGRVRCGACSPPAPPRPAGRDRGGGGLFSRDPNKGVVTVASDDTYAPDIFLKQGYCPPVQIRPGTEALVVYERGHEDDPAFVRYQGSISRDRARMPRPRPGHPVDQGRRRRPPRRPGRRAARAASPCRSASPSSKQHGGNVLLLGGVQGPGDGHRAAISADFSQVVEQVSVPGRPRRPRPHRLRRLRRGRRSRPAERSRRRLIGTAAVD